VAGSSGKGSGTKKKQDKAPVEPVTGLESILKKEPALKTTLQQIEKQFGEGSIMPLGGETQLKIEGISTGSLSLDLALGGIGLPRGRIIEVFGPESSGKTTIALHVCAEAQKAGGIAAIIDAEHAFDPSWGKKLGVELDTLLVSQPSSGEEAMQITEMLVKSNAVDVVVIDSVAALVPRQELEGEIGDSHVGLQARLMSQSMRKLTGAIARSKTAVIFINQIREKIGGMGYGTPETTPGGRALKFYASVRVDVRPPFRVAEFDMMHTNGISYEGDLIDLGIAHKILTKRGAWFKYGETYIGQGKEKARNYLAENKEVAKEIRQAIESAGGYSGPEGPATPEEAQEEVEADS